jgi:hypothetical protein
MAKLAGFPDETFSAMQHIRETALVRFDSLFSRERKLWTLEHLRQFHALFVERFDAGEGSFLEKWKKQLEGASDDILQLAAELLYVHNREYIFLMRLCEFVFWSLMPDEHGSKTRFQRVLDDEVRMSAVFEDFLRNFFQLHRNEYRVRAESPTWHVSDATQDDLALLPRMITDLTLRHPDHTIIIDAKFYRNALARGPYGERVRSQHLYQLITYLQHERARQSGRGLSGMLLYPDVGRSLRLRYRLLGIPILVATVDLGQDWRNIEAELHSLLDERATAACSPGGQEDEIMVAS